MLISQLVSKLPMILYAIKLLLQEAGIKKHEEFWLGLSDAESEGSFTWVDGTPLIPVLARWRQGECLIPFKAGEDEDGSPLISWISITVLHSQSVTNLQLSQ